MYTAMRVFMFWVNLFAATWGLARDLYVAPGGVNNPPYDSWLNAATQIEWAVNAGANGDSVWISNGVYVLTNQITVSNNLTISGTGGGVVVDGNNTTRCFYFNSVTGSLAHLFITRGNSTQHGGGVYAYMSKITVQDSVFSNNQSAGVGSYYGGGLSVYLSPSSVVQRCAFVENSAGTYGGGVAIVGTTAVVRVDHCTFYANVADLGGGLYGQSAMNTITGCDFICNVATGTTGCGGGCYHRGILTTSTLTSNVAMRAGGGVFGGSVMSNCAVVDNIAGVVAHGNSNGGGVDTAAVVRNCVFARNRLIGTSTNAGGGGIFARAGARIYDCLIEENSSTQFGGGLWIKDSDVVLRNCLIRHNVTVGFHGGGVAVWFAPPSHVTISSCTVVSNYSGSQAGGLYVGGNQNGVPLVENSIFYFNRSAGAGSNYTFSSSPATVFTNCCLAPALPVGITNVNTLTQSPQFVDLVAGDYRLTRASPCVNSGVIRSWMADANDLDGRARLDRFSGLVDVGCYEYLPVGMFINAR